MSNVFNMLRIAQFTFSPIAENTYVLFAPGGEAAIVDPGAYFAEEQAQLEAFITEQQLQVRYLLQTHCHLDHVFGLQACANRYGLQPHMHPLEQQVLAWAPESGRRWQLPFECYSGPVQYLQGGQQLTLAGQTLQVLEVPGHSPGHLAFYYAAGGFIVSGDVLFQGSIGRTDLPGANHQQLLSSIATQLWPLPDATVVLSGHGEATTIGAEKQTNPFLQDLPA